MMLWEGVTEFIFVAETESFTAASKKLGISTAQVSRQVSQLEKRLNTKLFYRTTRRVSLTSEGNIYYHHCRQALDGLEEAERAMTNLNDTPQGNIKMTAPVTYGEQYIMPIVLDFMQQYPQVSIRCDLTNQQVDLVQDGYDLAIRLGHLKDSSLIAKRLGSRNQYVCASPQYIQQFGAPHSLSELAQHNCLLANSPYWRFIENGKSRTIKVKGNLTTGSGYGLLDAAIRGMGIIQLPGYYVDKAIASEQLVPLLTQFQEPSEGIWALYPHNRQLSPKIKLLVAMIFNQLPNIPKRNEEA